MSDRLYAVPRELSEANRLVARWHRHHPYWSTDEGDAWDLLREHQDEAHD